MSSIHLSATVRNALLKVAVLAAVVWGTVTNGDAATPRKSFASPEQAVEALVAAARAKNQKSIVEILGPSMEEWILSGDPAQDALAEERFVAAFDERHSISNETAEKAVLLVGGDNFPFPFPLVKASTSWSFDPDFGKEELLNRRIGNNELTTIETLRAIVDAQREYASMDRDGDNVAEYAQKFRSSPGKKNGLFWEVKEGEAPSPLGSLLAAAEQQGYRNLRTAAGPAPFHGYEYRMLLAQGEKAPDGARNYVVKGKMIGGFAVVAFPVRHGVSGFKTFMVSHEGDVYEADLGPNTQAIASTIRAFNPDARWKKI